MDAPVVPAPGPLPEPWAGLKPSAHLDQLLRQTRAHHVQLSAMADAKANMLITVSSVLVTLSIGFIRDGRMRYAGGTLIVFCVMTILLAAYVAMPKLPGLRRPREPRRVGPGANLLFFGDFGPLSYDEYRQAVGHLVTDPGRAYEAMVREVYQIGQYLAQKKYRYLGWAYLCFVTGMAVTAVVWVVTTSVGG